MSWLLFLIIGGVAGWLASIVMKKQQGLLMNLVVGIAGAYVGGVIGRTIGLAATGLLGELVLSTVGAVVLLWIVSRLRA